jgi:predicted dehydrogenase
LRDVADHVDILGKTRSDAVFTADFNAGVRPEDARFSFEIRGSEGWITLTSDHPYGFQAGALKLMSNVPFAPPEEAAVSGGLMGAAINVGELYAHLAHDLQTGTYTTPGFEHAVHNARLIDSVRRAAERSSDKKWQCSSKRARKNLRSSSRNCNGRDNSDVTGAQRPILRRLHFTAFDLGSK